MGLQNNQRRTYRDLMESFQLMNDEQLDKPIVFVDGRSSRVQTLVGAGEFKQGGFIFHEDTIERIYYGFMEKELNLGGVDEGAPILVVG